MPIAGSLVNSVPDYRFRGNPHPGLWDRLGIDLPRRAAPTLSDNPPFQYQQMPSMEDLLRQRMENRRRQMEEERRFQEYLNSLSPEERALVPSFEGLRSGMPAHMQGHVQGGILT